MNYSSLLKYSTKNECISGFKKRGILDTLGNIICIPNEKTCPINDIKSYNLNDTIKDDYQMLEFKNYYLFYTNNLIDNEIISKIEINDEYPKYITKENFIFDYESYEISSYSSYPSNSYGLGGGGGGLGGGGAETLPANFSNFSTIA